MKKSLTITIIIVEIILILIAFPLLGLQINAITISCSINPISNNSNVNYTLSKSKTYENDQYYYSLIDSVNDKEAVITGIKGEGGHFIMIPTVIDNYKVVSLSYGTSNSTKTYPGFDYIYVPQSVSFYNISKDYTKRNILILENYSMAMKYKNLSFKIASFPRGINVNDLDKLEGETFDYEVANIIFCYNYDVSYLDDIYFFLPRESNTINEKVMYIPSDPKRDGYTFTGWYKEIECVNLFDFDEALPKLKSKDKTVFTNEDLTILYAGWIKNE